MKTMSYMTSSGFTFENFEFFEIFKPSGGVTKKNVKFLFSLLFLEQKVISGPSKHVAHSFLIYFCWGCSCSNKLILDNFLPNLDISNPILGVFGPHLLVGFGSRDKVSSRLRINSRSKGKLI